MKPGPTSPAMTDADRAGAQSTWSHSDPAEFWARVRKTDCCWVFMKASGREPVAQYGSFWFEGAWWRPNRLAWTLTHGAIPDGMWALHRCDVPSCVNPAHLFLGTNADNNRDRGEKTRAGRYRFSDPSVCVTCDEPRRTARAFGGAA